MKVPDLDQKRDYKLMNPYMLVACLVLRTAIS